MHVSELDTPALLINLDIFERNLCRVGEYAKANDLRLRPHTKTHKVPAVGKRQLDSGAMGLTVAKVGEAEVMLGSGTPDLLVAYPVIGRVKLERLTDVARRTKVTVALDSSFAARQLSEAARQAQVNFAVLAEVDVGLGRVGVTPGEELVQLAQAIERLPRLTFEGITFYPGHIKMLGEDGPEESLRQLGRTVRAMLDDFRRAGIEVRVVSGGSTPTLFRSHEVTGVNEIRPGTYVYNDVNTVRSGGCTWDDCAVSILTTVVSTARKGHMIVDGGSKTFSYDRFQGGDGRGFGIVKEDPAAEVERFSEEHGHLNISRSERSYRVGDRLSIIPNHVCTTVNMHDEIYGVRGEQVQEIWRVAGRGKVR